MGPAKQTVARRVVQLLTAGRSETLLARSVAEMVVGTIHATCLELLKGESSSYLKYEVSNEVRFGGLALKLVTWLG